MVQIYNPNVVGKHILIDIKNIECDKLKLVDDIKLFHKYFDQAFSDGKNY